MPTTWHLTTTKLLHNMKRLLLTNIVTLLALCLNAQTDITKYYLANYGFDENFDYTASQSNNVAQELLVPDGWTFYVDNANYTIIGIYEFGFSGKFNSGTVPSKGYDDETGGGLAISTGWGKTFQFYQTVTLPAGTYTLRVPTYNGSAQTSATSQVAWVPNSGTAVRSSRTTYSANAWTLDQITFTLTQTTTGRIQFGMKAVADVGSGSTAKLVIDYVQLMAQNMAVDKSGLQSMITSANSYYGNGTGNEASTLKSAIDAAQAVYDGETDNMLTVLDATYTLKEAIEAYRKVNVSEENPLDKTELILNPSFEDGLKNWDSEIFWTQTNADFTKKAGSVYVEKWVASGNSAGNGYVKQTLTDLPNGKYKLTIAAQNYSQNNVTKNNTGAYVFADDQRTPVYTPADYSVKFTNITGEVEIGFVAENATGNWICVDNFRLYLIGYVSTEEAVAEVQRLVGVATALQSSMMSGTIATALQAAIDAGSIITVESAEADMQAAVKNLKKAITDSQASAAEYQALADKISSVESNYNENKEGASDLKAELDEAKALLANADATSDELAAEIEALDKALLAFRIANATPGSGTAPEVTKTVHYVATGATQTLMRATVTGSNIMEHGVCWSTEHNPTVLDERTTKSFDIRGTIYHVKDLQPATVYYLRPYVMNKTYTVAYGDEVKIVTHPQGTCTGSWDEGAPDEAANKRCREAIQQTIDYFNEWTGIQGFHLSGHYGADTQTADCSYGGWMRIGPNAGNQAIGTVIHETGHGVGVGTSDRYWDTNLHNWWWFGRETNTIYQFLENKLGDSEYIFKGDGTHAWGGKEDSYSSYDWFVNGSDKDTHQEIQYIGGCCILHGMFIDGVCPTTGYMNGLAGYTYNFDDAKKYYLMCKDASRGLGTGLFYQPSKAEIGWNNILADEELNASAGWYLEFNAQNGCYRFKNAQTGKYLTHSSSSIDIKTIRKTPGITEEFQLMPDRTDVTLYPDQGGITTHGYWFTWYDSNDKVSKSVNAEGYSTSRQYGTVTPANFDFSDAATKQQWIIISEDEIEAYRQAAIIATDIKSITAGAEQKNGSKAVKGIYSTNGMQLKSLQSGLNIVKYNDGTTRKIYVK